MLFISALLSLPTSSLAAELPAQVYEVDQFDYKSAHEKADDATERLRLYKIVDDEQASKGKALVVTLSKALVRKDSFPILSVPGLDKPAPGLYRATVRMKVQGMLNTLGTGVHIDVGRMLSRTVYMNEFDEEDVYQEFGLDFEVREGDIKAWPPDVFLETARQRLNLTNETTVAALKAALAAKPNQELVFDAAKAKDLPLTDSQILWLNSMGQSPSRMGITLSFPKNKTGQTGQDDKGERGVSTPFPSLRKLTVDWVRVEKVQEPDTIVIREVKTQYAWRRPGEQQKFRIWMHNRSGKDRTAQLRLTVKFGLDRSLVLGEKPVTVKNGAYQTMAWTWDVPVNAYRYGYEVEAEIVEGGKAVAANRSWFMVHPRVTAVQIPATQLNGLCDVRYHDPYAPIPSVANYDEFWAPTPYDSAGLVPEDVNAPYSRGNSGGFMTIRENAERVKRDKDLGIGTAFYLEGHGTGCKAWDVYFDKPEQTVYATIQTEEFYIKRRHCLTNDYPKFLKGEWKDEKFPGREPGYPHTGFVMYNGLFKEPVDRVIKGAIELSRLTGIEGIRWDSSLPFAAFNTSILGQNFGKTPEELTKIHRENFARFQKELRAANPNFEWRMNAGIGALMDKPEDPFDFAKARQIIENDFHRVFVADDAGIQEEGWGFSFYGYTEYKNILLNYLRAVRYESAAYKYAGGHHAHMHSHNTGMYYTPDDIYMQMFDLVGGAHIDSINYAPMPDSDLDLGIYAARFGEFFWDPKLTQLEKIGDKVSLNTEEDLWYTEAGFEKDTDRGTHLYILPIINPPAAERFLRNRFGQLPAPIRKPIGVTVKVPGGYTKVKAVYLLENSPYPTVKPLAFKAGKGTVTYEIPELVIFKVSAVEFGK